MKLSSRGISGELVLQGAPRQALVHSRNRSWVHIRFGSCVFTALQQLTAKLIRHTLKLTEFGQRFQPSLLLKVAYQMTCLGDAEWIVASDEELHLREILL